MKNIYVLILFLVLFSLESCYITKLDSLDTPESKEIISNLNGTWNITSMKIRGRKPSSTQFITYDNFNVGTLTINRLVDPEGYDFTKFNFLFSAYDKLMLPQLGVTVLYPLTSRLIEINYLTKGIYSSRSYAVPYDDDTYSYLCSSKISVLPTGEIQITWKNENTFESGEMILKK